MTARPLPFTAPRLMTEAEAARYLGMSVNTFRGLGIAAKRSEAARGRKFFDRLDLEEWADALPYEGEGASRPNPTEGLPSCDDLIRSRQAGG